MTYTVTYTILQPLPGARATGEASERWNQTIIKGITDLGEPLVLVVESLGVTTVWGRAVARGGEGSPGSERDAQESVRAARDLGRDGETAAKAFATMHDALRFIGSLFPTGHTSEVRHVLRDLLAREARGATPLSVAQHVDAALRALPALF